MREIGIRDWGLGIRKKGQRQECIVERRFGSTTAEPTAFHF
jgi:hypothetical protein